MLGVEQRTLSRLIGTAAIDTHARELHLALSDQAIADIIRTDPAFQDATGKFSTDTFRGLLRQNGIPEARYLATRRKEEVRDQLTDTLLAGRLASPAADRPAAIAIARRRASSSSSRPTTTSSSRSPSRTRPSSRSTTSRASASS